MYQSERETINRQQQITARKAEIFNDPNYRKTGTVAAQALQAEMLELAHESVALQKRQHEPNTEEREQEKQQLHHSAIKEKEIRLNRYKQMLNAPEQSRQLLSQLLPPDHATQSGLTEQGFKEMAELEAYLAKENAGKPTPEQLKIDLQRNTYLEAIEAGDMKRAKSMRDMLTQNHPELAEELPEVVIPNSFRESDAKATAIRDAARQEREKLHPTPASAPDSDND